MSKKDSMWFDCDETDDEEVIVVGSSGSAADAKKGLPGGGLLTPKQSPARDAAPSAPRPKVEEASGVSPVTRPVTAPPAPGKESGKEGSEVSGKGGDAPPVAKTGKTAAPPASSPSKGGKKGAKAPPTAPTQKAAGIGKPFWAAGAKLVMLEVGGPGKKQANENRGKDLQNHIAGMLEARAKGEGLCMCNNQHWEAAAKEKCRCTGVASNLAVMLREVHVGNKLRFSTVKNYFGCATAYVAELPAVHHGGNWTRAEKEWIDKFKEMLEELAADEKSDSCMGMMPDRGSEIIRTMEEKGYKKEAFCLYVISLSGCRQSCIVRISGKDFVFLKHAAAEDVKAQYAKEEMDPGFEIMAEMSIDLGPDSDSLAAKLMEEGEPQEEACHFELGENAKVNSVEEAVDRVEKELSGILGINVRLAKNIRKMGHKHVAIYDLHENHIKPPACFEEIINEIAAQAVHNPQVKFFEDITTERVLQAMKKCGISETTYHFRKHFAARIFSKFKRDAEMLGRRMGHRGNYDNAQAFYIGAQALPVVQYYDKVFHPAEVKELKKRDTAYKAKLTKAKNQAEKRPRDADEDEEK